MGRGGLVDRAQGILRRLRLSRGEYLAAAHSLALIRSSLGVGSAGDLLDLLGEIGFPEIEGAGELARYSLSLAPSPAYVRRLQLLFPELVDRRERKILAMYPTDEKGVKTIARLVSESGAAGGRAAVADPFMGTGALLVACVEAIGDVGSVWGIEAHPVAALIGYSLLLHLIPDPGRVRVEVGDAFSKVMSRPSPPGGGSPGAGAYAADIVVSNPPFTRWELLDQGYRSLLRRLFAATEYSRYITRAQLNLALLGVFVMDAVLSRGGLLASVVPASLFYTLAGRAVKRLLLERYSSLAVAKGSPSFSSGSGFVELIIYGVKDAGDGGEEKEISTIAGDGGKHVLRLGRGFLLDTNWLLLFNADELGLVERLLSLRRDGRMARLGELVGRGNVVRGVEMYGPDFFIIPNRLWSVAGLYDSYVAVRSGDLELEIPRELLVKTLRSPGSYKHALVEPSHFLLSIPPTDLDRLPRGVRVYIEHGARVGTAAPALKFGRYWYSHIHRQLGTKQPYGRLFLPDKVAPEEFRVFMTREPVTATKNFYVVKTLDREILDLLFKWFNSQEFKRVFRVTGRYVSSSWTRYVEEDYLNALVPVSLEAMLEIANPGGRL